MMVTEASKGGYTITVDVPYPVDAVWAIVHYYVGKTWDDAVSYAAQAEPMPLVSSEPWVEGDVEYGRRLGFYDTMQGCPSEWLDRCGVYLGLPRARLTSVT